jgi:hypothetical protein
MDNQKPPSPLLAAAPIIGGIALAVNVVWIYLNIRHWKDANADYMAIALNIVGTGLLWIGLAGAIWWNVRNARRSAQIASRGDFAAQTRPDPKRLGRAGAIHSKAGQAEFLVRKLEEVWHIYDQEKSAADSPLIRPLSSTALPQSISEWRHKQLWEFRTIYNFHLNGVRTTEPDFHSAIVDGTFPSGITYLDLKRDLEKHAAALRRLADSLSEG